MKSSAKKLRKLAERLIAHEDAGNKNAESTSSAFPVCERLRPQLSTLMGSAGFYALLCRSINLARREVSWLRMVEVNPDGYLHGLEEDFVKVRPKEWHEGRIALLAHLLGLLIGFVGEALTLKLIREIWPKLPQRDLELDGVDK